MKTYSEILKMKEVPGSPTNSVSLQMLQNMAGLRIAVLDSEAQSKRIKDDAATAQ